MSEGAAHAALLRPAFHFHLISPKGYHKPPQNFKLFRFVRLEASVYAPEKPIQELTIPRISGINVAVQPSAPNNNRNLIDMPPDQRRHPSPSQHDFDPASLPCKRVQLGVDEPLALTCGGSLGPYWLAYQTYGRLNADKSNAILICHALTGDQFVAETHPVTGKPGWWEDVVGAKKLIDTEKYCVICVNVLGGCMGSEGPLTVNQATGKIWALDFPVITIHDMVRAQKSLIDSLGIAKLFMVVGGSMGGMQVLSWAALFPDNVNACAVLATAARHTAQNIAFGEVGRQAIMADPLWRKGDYIKEQTRPAAGLSVARMAAHITYLSEAALQRKFGRRLQDRSAVSFGFDADFQVESYLRHQGESFVERFDPNSYLYITRAMDYFDIANNLGDGSLAAAFQKTPTRFFIASFTSDWLFPTSESRVLVKALSGVGADVSFVEIESDKGHDAFLLDEPEFHRQLAGFIRGCEDKLRNASQPATNPRLRHAMPDDLRMVIDFVPEGATVLDIGCGEGRLLQTLVETRRVKGFGLEVDQTAVQNAIAKGLPVIQGDANTDLTTYADDAFDVAILNHTLSELRNPLEILRQLKRIAKRTIVSVANFGHWHARLHFAVLGHAPVTKAMPYQWYDSPNIRFCTLDDFGNLASAAGLAIDSAVPLDSSGKPLPPFLAAHANFFAAQSLYALSRTNQNLHANRKIAETTAP